MKPSDLRTVPLRMLQLQYRLCRALSMSIADTSLGGSFA
jgi:hypothetical protein